jgi:AcrR family transcriptional regulator
MSKQNNIQPNIMGPKYQSIIDASRKLFMRYGIKRVSVEEICRTADVSKMTFYKHFKNKNDLVLRLLKEDFASGTSRYRSIMDQDISFENKAKQLIQMKLDQTEDMSQEMMIDIIHSPIPEVAEFFQETKQRNFKMLLEDFAGAQEKGDIRKDVKLEFMLYILNLMIEMAEDERLVGLYSSPKELTSELINFFFYGILARTQK